MNVNREEYNRICNIKLLERIYLMDRCKCDKCKKEVKLLNQILQCRDSSKSAEG